MRDVDADVVQREDASAVVVVDVLLHDRVGADLHAWPAKPTQQALDEQTRAGCRAETPIAPSVTPATSASADQRHRADRAATAAACSTAPANAPAPAAAVVSVSAPMAASGSSGCSAPRTCSTVSATAMPKIDPVHHDEPDGARRRAPLAQVPQPVDHAAGDAARPTRPRCRRPARARSGAGASRHSEATTYAAIAQASTTTEPRSPPPAALRIADAGEAADDRRDRAGGGGERVAGDEVAVRPPRAGRPALTARRG